MQEEENVDDVVQYAIHANSLINITGCVRL
jgi:hypothetical protein